MLTPKYHYQRLFALTRRCFIGLLVAYVFTSFVFGGDGNAETVLWALALAWGTFLWFFGRVNTTGWLYRAELVAWNIGLMLVLAEVGLRFYVAASGKSLLLDDTLDAYRLVPGRDYGAGLWGNELGYPGRAFLAEKRPGSVRIAALGDSFAVGPAVAFSENYLTLLQTLVPNTEVYNFGVSGTGPREYLEILRRDVWRFDPDLVLVSVFVGNDITESLATPRNLDPRTHCLYLLATRTWRLLQESQRRDETASLDRLHAGALSEAAFREVEARRMAVSLNSPSDKLKTKWRRALGYLDEIVTECRRREIPVAFVIIPDEFQINEKVWNTALEDGGYQRAHLDRDGPQRRLIAWCESRSAPVLDLLPCLRETPDVYAVRDTHWNERGNRVAAEEIARWLPRQFAFLATVSPRTPAP